MMRLLIKATWFLYTKARSSSSDSMVAEVVVLEVVGVLAVVVWDQNTVHFQFHAHKLISLGEGDSIFPNQSIKANIYAWTWRWVNTNRSKNKQDVRRYCEATTSMNILDSSIFCYYSSKRFDNSSPTVLVCQIIGDFFLMEKLLFYVTMPDQNE